MPGSIIAGVIDGGVRLQGEVQRPINASRDNRLEVSDPSLLRALEALRESLEALAAREEPVRLRPGDDDLGRVGTHSRVVELPLRVNTSAYDAGDCVGTVLPLRNALRTPGGTGILHSLTLTDAGNESAPLTLLLFQAPPLAGTYTNNAALALGADLRLLLGKVSIAASDYQTVDSKGIVTLTGIGLPVQAAPGSRDLFAVTLTTGTPQYSLVDDLLWKFGFLLD